MLSRPEILLQVAEISRLTPRVSAYRLVSSDGDDLPAWKAGAHLNLRLPSGRARCYSLCGDPALRSEYLIAVQREDDGDGGSLEVAQAFARGFTVRTDLPRNGFPLADAKRHVLIAAGIGITPIIAMIHEARRTGADFFTHIFSRSVEETAFNEIIAEEIAAGRAALHHGASDPSRGPSLVQLVGEAADGAHVYACGPLGFLAAFARQPRTGRVARCISKASRRNNMTPLARGRSRSKSHRAARSCKCRRTRPSMRFSKIMVT